jgi:Spy/CpxP family protein refolding chaperone
MKKTIIAIVAFALFSTGSSFAQKGYSSKSHNAPTTVYHADYTYGDYNINKLDHIVGLTRKQENQIKKIEKHYDRIAVTNRKGQTLHTLKRLELQKQQEVISVLTPVQHQRLMAYEQGLKYGRNGNRSNRRG